MQVTWFEQKNTDVDLLKSQYKRGSMYIEDFNTH